MKNTLMDILYLNGQIVLQKSNHRVLSMHRSISLSKNKVYEIFNFINWLRNEKVKKIRPYHVKNLLKEHDGNTYLLTFGTWTI